MKLIATFIILFFSVFGLGISLAKKGESKGKYIFWVDLLSFVILMFLYWCAGLFDIFLQ